MRDDHGEEALCEHGERDDEQDVRFVSDRKVAGERQAHGRGVDAEGGRGSLWQPMAHMACCYDSEQYEVARKAETEDGEAECFETERRGGQGCHDNAHVGDKP